MCWVTGKLSSALGCQKSFMSCNMKFSCCMTWNIYNKRVRKKNVVVQHESFMFHDMDLFLASQCTWKFPVIQYTFLQCSYIYITILYSRKWSASKIWVFGKITRSFGYPSRCGLVPSSYETTSTVIYYTRRCSWTKRTTKTGKVKINNKTVLK
jgi:hypothetical protein